jgi:charged multivesicular body protein 6
MGGGQSKSKAKKPKGEVTEIDRAVLDLKVSRDRLTRYKKKLHVDSEKLLVKAKSLKQNNETKAALGLLKLRKMKEKEVDNIGSQLISIQTMVSNIQTKEQEAEVLTALRSGKNALEKLHKENTLEDVLNLMEEVEEQNEMEREINDVLMNTGETLTGIEEDELELELQALMGVDADKVQNGEDKLDLPAVPSNNLPEIVKPVEASKQQQPARVAVPS